MPDTRPLLVQSDFDDTITVGNVSSIIREAFAPDKWREMEKEFYAGKYSVEESNVRQFALVRASAEQIEELLSTRVEVREGFEEFVRYCETEDIRFVVVSSGLDLYVKPTMRRIGLGHVEAHAATTTVSPDGLGVSYTGPSGEPIGTGFKDSFARHFKSQGYRTVYIGDGLSDVGPAGHADHVVARSTLEAKLQAKGLPYYPFSTFDDVRRRGHEVTVFERGVVPNPEASSTDVSKAIRRTWYGDVDVYVELVERAASIWRSWERSFPAPVYHQVGQLLVLRDFVPGSPMYESHRFLQGRGSAIELLTHREARSLFPQFAIDEREICLRDPWAGYLESGQAVLYMSRMAEQQGVRLAQTSPVTEVAETPDGVRVHLAQEHHDFDLAVVATGVWMGRLVPALAPHLRVTHQQMVFIEVEAAEKFAHGAFPMWAFDPDGGGWYGFPLLREGYLKVAKEEIGEEVDPDVDRGGTADFARTALAFLEDRIPELAAGRVVGGRSCLYANTPDDHFFIDRAPGSSRIFVAGGGSGHGFKFGGAIGEVVADVLEERDNPVARVFRIGDRLDKPPDRPAGVRGFAAPRAGAGG